MAHPACTIGAGIAIKGRVTGSSELTVAGSIEGELALDAGLVISAGGTVTADVSATNVVVRGTLVGNVAATGGVSVEAGGRLIGDVRTGRIAIAEGAVVRGSIDMDIPA